MYMIMIYQSKPNLSEMSETCWTQKSISPPKPYVQNGFFEQLLGQVMTSVSLWENMSK